MTDLDHPGLDAALRGAAPAPPDPAEQERVFADVWTRVQTAMAGGATPEDDLAGRRLDLIADREKSARRRRRAARVASAALAVAVAGGGTAAAAEFISTRTGGELTGWEVGSGGSGEVLDKGGSDWRQVFDEVTADIPFAPGYTTQRDRILDAEGPDPGSFVTRSHLRSSLAAAAICTWADAWVAADDAGDAAARTQAADTLVTSLTWEPVLTFAEDHGEAAPADSGTGESYFGWLRPLAAGARSGDRQAVLGAVVDGHVCAPDVLPVIDAELHLDGSR